MSRRNPGKNVNPHSRIHELLETVGYATVHCEFLIFS